mmetsp:Transcript_16250/g.49487  ORF Transcript_16250/g.49487 Transcript_16250/m.49487 type:complete len:148 (+) Transcript_16250:1529-1972(+)
MGSRFSSKGTGNCDGRLFPSGTAITSLTFGYFLNGPDKPGLFLEGGALCVDDAGKLSVVENPGKLSLLDNPGKLSFFDEHCKAKLFDPRREKSDARAEPSRRDISLEISSGLGPFHTVFLPVDAVHFSQIYSEMSCAARGVIFTHLP